MEVGPVSSTTTSGNPTYEAPLGRAVVMRRFGPPDVLQMTHVAVPTPRDHEILIRVHAASVNRGDIIARTFGTMSARQFSMPTPMWFMMRGHFGTRTPRVPTPGSEYSGVVAAIGRDVDTFTVGQSVFGSTGMTMGANAEYVCVPHTGAVTEKPPSLSHVEAATATAGTLTALRLLRRAELRPGSRVLVLGASGGIGSATVQIAKNVYGAHVTGIGGARSQRYIRSLGADATHDYATYDPGTTLERYDLVIDVLGKGSLALARHLLAPRGVYMYVSFKTRHLLQMVATTIVGDRRIRCVLASGPASDMERVRELLESRRVRSVIDRCFPLAHTAEAHAYVESGDKAGHVAILVGPHACAEDARDVAA